MSYPPAPLRSSIWTRSDFWVGLMLGSGVVLTTLTGLAIGWFSIYFQFFGETADGDDYAIAAGAFGAAALVLVLGAVAAGRFPAPRWIGISALGAAGVHALLAFWAALEAGFAETGPGYDHWWDGAGAVTACPWTWPLVVLGVLGMFRHRPA